MNYWHLLAEARAALEAGDFRGAETFHDAARSARERDARRVFLSETVPDGVGRLWQRVTRREQPPAIVGRWQRAETEFRSWFGERAAAVVQRAERVLELGPGHEPETSFTVLDAALYLSVGSRLAERRLAAAPLVGALFDLLPATGKLCARDLVTPALGLEPALRLRLADSALDGLARLPHGEQADWAGTLLAVLAAEGDWSESALVERDWLAASLSDRYREDAAEVLAAWRACDTTPQPDARRQWSCLRRLEILAGCDRRQLPLPRYGEAHHLSWRLPRDERSPLWQRARRALAVIEHRQPPGEPSRGWLSAVAGAEACVRLVYWWGAEPRDTAVWRPEFGADALAEIVAAAGGRVVWGGDGGQRPLDAGWPVGGRGRALAPYLEALLEPLLPPSGWNDEFARRIALARSGPWRDGWRDDVGHPLLGPPGPDGRFASATDDLVPALETGLLWLAVLHRVDTADPALRAGLAELARRGDPAAAFLHDGAVLGAPDKVAVDATFAAWTLPLLWTRPDPLSSLRPGDADEVERPDLAGQDVAVVTTARPAAAIAAWGPGQRRWRAVVDRLDRLGELRRQAREAYGPVTVVPAGGRVHDLDAALRLLGDLAAEAAAGAGGLLAIYHWIRLVETHNGDLLDAHLLRPRPAGTCPLHDRYAARVATLARAPVPPVDAADDGSWAAQYAQRVRRSGLVAGLAEDLPAHGAPLDALWGVYDGSDASWVFLDSAAVHWRLHGRDPGAAARLHALLATRGRRHLSLLGARGLLSGELAAWFDDALAAYGRPYHLDLDHAPSARLRLVGGGPLPDARLAPGTARAAVLAHLGAAGPETVVLATDEPLEAAFWREAAAGRFGEVRWRLGPAAAGLPATRLVVPRLAALGAEGPTAIAAADTPAAWHEADGTRRAWLARVRRLAALESVAILAEPVDTVEILDGRWWRLLAADDQPPIAVRADADQGAFIDLRAVARGEAARRLGLTIDAWLAEQGGAPGILPGWNGPPLAGGQPLAAAGRRVHLAGFDALWRDLAADLLRAWEGGEPVPRLLVVGAVPPPGAAVLVAACGGAGASTLAAEGEERWGPLVWTRPDDLTAGLRAGRPLPAGDRILVLELEQHLPPGSATGAHLLRWLAAGRCERLDLVGRSLAPAWLAFLARELAAEVPAATAEPGGWPVLRRGEVPRPKRRCPQCGHQGPGVVDGLICARCSYHLAGPGPRPADADRLDDCARRLLAQTDLGRDRPLEIWCAPTEVGTLREQAMTAGARGDADAADLLTLPDGRRWHLHAISDRRLGATGPAVLLRPPRDPADLVPRAGGDQATSLTLVYDRLDVAPRSLGSTASAAARLLQLLRDPGWLDEARPAGVPAGFPLSVARWRLAWLAGLSPGEVHWALERLRWAGVLGGELPPPERELDGPPRSCRVLLQSPPHEIELALASCAARLEPTLGPLLAGGIAGAWQTVRAPLEPERDLSDREPRAPRVDALDVLIGLAATWNLAGGGRLVYQASRGAHFSDRRLIGWLGDRERLVSDLLDGLDRFAEWIRALFAESVRVDGQYIVPLSAPGGADAGASLLLGQELGFWNVAAAGDPAYLDRAELRRLVQTPVIAADGPAAALLAELAAARDAWQRRLVATVAGGALVAAPPDEPPGVPPATARPWWRRGGQGPRHDARAAVAACLAAPAPARLVLVGVCGTGRTDAVLGGLLATDAGRRAEIWCPDQPTAVHLHLGARRLDPTWQPDLHVWQTGDPLPGRSPGAPGEPRCVVIAELQRFPRDTAYRLQELAREGRLVLTVDPGELAGTWEDLFLVTPRRDEVRSLRVQLLQAQQAWRVARPLHPAGTCEAQGQRRERGVVEARQAGSLDECVAAVAAAVSTGRLGGFVHLTAPLAEDVHLLARALADRGWAAVSAEELDPLLLPGCLEVVAACADAHRIRHGVWPAGESRAEPADSQWLLAALVPDAIGRDWGAWLRALPETVLDDAAAFLAHLRRSPWGPHCGAAPAVRQRALALAPTHRPPTDLLGAAVWQAWCRRLAEVLDRADLRDGPPAVSLATAAAPGGGCVESVVYVCFGSEPAAVHRRVFARATDRLLVLYQEQSPLPGDREP